MTGRRRDRNPSTELGFQRAQRRRQEVYIRRMSQAQGLHQELLVTAQYLAAVVARNPRHASVARSLIPAMTKTADRIAAAALQDQLTRKRKEIP